MAGKSGLSMETSPENVQNLEQNNQDSSGWDGWGGYMHAKVQKLQCQFTERSSASIDVQSSDSPDTRLFNGISIFVNGYTVPSASDLKRLMLQYGGTYHGYKLSSTTHVIASNLPYSKLIKLGKDDHVIKPEWITDSIKAGYLLPDSAYEIRNPSVATTIPIEAFADKARSILNSDRLGSSSNFDKQGSDLNLVKSGVNIDLDKPGLNLIFDKPGSSSDLNKPCASSNLDKPDSSLELDKCGTSLNNHGFNSNSSIELGGHRSIPKTSDPSFVSEFYAHSRLHFISSLAQDMKDFLRRCKFDKSTTGLNEEKLSNIPILVTHLSQVPSGLFYMHVDMDCFFVSVGVRKRNHLVGKPVVICHSKGSGPASGASTDGGEFHSRAEIASCSYETRKFGLKNGMFLGDALKLCPNLIPIPYDFEEYRCTSEALYRIILQYASNIESVSCDEMYAEVGSICRQYGVSAVDLASAIRHDICQKTGCNASIGMGPTLLVARMATRVAKPNGQHFVGEENVEEFMQAQKISDLPGVGYATIDKLSELNVQTCAQLLAHPRAEVSRIIGDRLTRQILNACVGIDHRKIEEYTGRKSISCTINYGIRLQDRKEAEEFLLNLATEVSRRLTNSDSKCKLITLQLLVRAKDAPVETTKFLGCGKCDSFSKSIPLTSATNDANVLWAESKSLLTSLNPVIVDLRGVGISVHRLVQCHPIDQYSKIKRFFTDASNHHGSKTLRPPIPNLHQPHTSNAPVQPDPWAGLDLTEYEEPSATTTSPKQMGKADFPTLYGAQDRKGVCLIISELAKESQLSLDSCLDFGRYVISLVHHWQPEQAEETLKDFERMSSVAMDPGWLQYAQAFRQLYDISMTSTFG